MPAAPEEYFTLVEAFELKVPLSEFRPLVVSMMKRLDVEGVAGLVPTREPTLPSWG